MNIVYQKNADSGCPDCLRGKKQPPGALQGASGGLWTVHRTKKNATSGRTAAQPRRVSLAINQKRLSARWDLKLSADVDKIIAFDHLFGQGENPTKSRSQFVHNWSIRQRMQEKVLFCGKMNKKIEIALQIRENVLS